MQPETIRMRPQTRISAGAAHHHAAYPECHLHSGPGNTLYHIVHFEQWWPALAPSPDLVNESCHNPSVTTSISLRKFAQRSPLAKYPGSFLRCRPAKPGKDLMKFHQKMIPYSPVVGNTLRFQHDGSLTRQNEVSRNTRTVVQQITDKRSVRDYPACLRYQPSITAACARISSIGTALKMPSSSDSDWAKIVPSSAFNRHGKAVQGTRRRRFNPPAIQTILNLVASDIQTVRWFLSPRTNTAQVGTDL